MNINLEGKKALVGGSSKGLGKAIAIRLAECGASVTLMARNEEMMKQVIAGMPSGKGQRHEYRVVDYMDFESFRKIADSFFAENKIDILVNNTNGPSTGTALTKAIEDYQKAFDLLFKVACHLTLSALPGMKENGFGRIINVASMSVKEPIPHLVLSNTVRSALVSWSKSLSRDVAAWGITVNSLVTGYFDTERLNETNKEQAAQHNMSLDDWKERMAADVPAKRLGRPEEFGYLTAFLASDLASYITGASIPIDGGLLRGI
jgi:3-oxoacyl-[acyl-carrier protein] reductase